MRNIFLSEMASAAHAHLSEKLEASLEAFSSFERMTADPMALIRAVYKELHPKGDYAKGKGRSFGDWRFAKAYHVPFMPLERAKAARQDLAFDGCVPIFVNRLVLTRFLGGRVALVEL